jgi:hypothetical protein
MVAAASKNEVASAQTLARSVAEGGDAREQLGRGADELRQRSRHVMGAILQHIHGSITMADELERLANDAHQMRQAGADVLGTDGGNRSESAPGEP